MAMLRGDRDVGPRAPSAAAETRRAHAGMTALVCWVPAGLVSWDPASLEQEETRQREGRWMTSWEGAGVVPLVLQAGLSLHTPTDAKWLLS